MKNYTDAELKLITEKFISLRQIIGLEDYQAAEYLSISKIRYSQIESGEVFPSQTEIDKLCYLIKLPKTLIRDNTESLREFEERVYSRLEEMRSRKVEYRGKSPQKLGAKLRVVRKSHYLTQDQMANILGLTYKLYSSYERGDPNIPRVYFDKVTTIFRIPQYWLLDDHISTDDFENFYREREKMQTEAIASLQHYVCRVDKDGGIHIPYAVCRNLKLTHTTGLVITQNDDNTFQISKAAQTCWFCGCNEEITAYKNFAMCKSCIENMTELVGAKSRL